MTSKVQTKTQIRKMIENNHNLCQGLEPDKGLILETRLLREIHKNLEMQENDALKLNKQYEKDMKNIQKILVEQKDLKEMCEVKEDKIKQLKKMMDMHCRSIKSLKLKLWDHETLENQLKLLQHEEKMLTERNRKLEKEIFRLRSTFYKQTILLNTTKKEEIFVQNLNQETTNYQQQLKELQDAIQQKGLRGESPDHTAKAMIYQQKFNSKKDMIHYKVTSKKRVEEEREDKNRELENKLDQERNLEISRLKKENQALMENLQMLQSAEKMKKKAEKDSELHALMRENCLLKNSIHQTEAQINKEEFEQTCPDEGRAVHLKKGSSLLSKVPQRLSTNLQKFKVDMKKHTGKKAKAARREDDYKMEDDRCTDDRVSQSPRHFKGSSQKGPSSGDDSPQEESFTSTSVNDSSEGKQEIQDPSEEESYSEDSQEDERSTGTSDDVCKLETESEETEDSEKYDSSSQEEQEESYSEDSQEDERSTATLDDVSDLKTESEETQDSEKYDSSVEEEQEESWETYSEDSQEPSDVPNSWDESSSEESNQISPAKQKAGMKTEVSPKSPQKGVKENSGKQNKGSPQDLSPKDNKGRTVSANISHQKLPSTPHKDTKMTVDTAKPTRTCDGAKQDLIPKVYQAKPVKNTSDDQNSWDESSSEESNQISPAKQKAGIKTEVSPRSPQKGVKENSGKQNKGSPQELSPQKGPSTSHKDTKMTAGKAVKENNSVRQNKDKNDTSLLDAMNELLLDLDGPPSPHKDTKMTVDTAKPTPKCNAAKEELGSKDCSPYVAFKENPIKVKLPNNTSDDLNRCDNKSFLKDTNEKTSMSQNKGLAQKVKNKDILVDSLDEFLLDLDGPPTQNKNSMSQNKGLAQDREPQVHKRDNFWDMISTQKGQSTSKQMEPLKQNSNDIMATGIKHEVIKSFLKDTNEKTSRSPNKGLAQDREPQVHKRDNFWDMISTRPRPDTSSNAPSTPRKLTQEEKNLQMAKRLKEELFSNC